jgi:hypothetical protein
MRCAPDLRRSWSIFVTYIALAITIAGGEARADWPCADSTRYRVVRARNGDKPIAIAAPNERAVYGELTSVELNNDGKHDVLFRSGCIRGPSDSVRLYRVFASCGPAADGVEELVMVYEEEELCTRQVELTTLAHQSKAGGVLWQDLQLARTMRGKTCERATEPLQFDGSRYQSGPRTTGPCKR